MERQILEVLHAFNQAAEIIRGKKDGTYLKFELKYEMDYKKTPDIVLKCDFWDTKTWQTCIAASLDLLVAEVLKRLSFSDNQMMELDRIQQSLVALPETAFKDDDIPF